MADNETFGKPLTTEKSRTLPKPPPLYHVLLHNDDYTTMQFVIEVLQKVFSKPRAEANRIMLDIHTQGLGVAGTYPFEIAETKMAKVHALAKGEGFPLRCSLKEA